MEVSKSKIRSPNSFRNMDSRTITPSAPPSPNPDYMKDLMKQGSITKFEKPSNIFSFEISNNKLSKLTGHCLGATCNHIHRSDTELRLTEKRVPNNIVIM